MCDSRGNLVSVSASMARYSKHLEMGAMLGMLGIAGSGRNAQLAVMWSFETFPSCYLTYEVCDVFKSGGYSWFELDQLFPIARTYGSVLKAQNKQTNELARHLVLFFAPKVCE